ncbi:5591_t:CDS:2, partial [Funneliformis mosseae]
MVGGRYAIVYANSTGSTTLLQSPFISQGGIYTIILEFGLVTKRKPVILYPLSMLGITFTDISCDISYVEVGQQTCIVTGEDKSGNDIDIFYLKVDFLSSGAAYNIKPLASNFQTVPGIEKYNIKSLPYGGYILCGRGIDIGGKNVVACYILNDNNEVFPWDLSNPTTTSSISISTILNNNTYVLAQLGSKQNWTLLTTDLYKIEEERDHGYNNIHINTTYPNINDIIQSDIEYLTIQYYDEVVLSTGKIAIYQDDGNLRQIITGINDEYVNIGEDYKDNKTIKVDIFKSTFNLPGRTYYVVVEDNFVRNLAYQEPLYGVKERVWSFNTFSRTVKSEESLEYLIGHVRLTIDGTNYFDSLNEIARNVFITNLTKELADAIPISSDRIIINKKTEIDPSEEQMILSIKIQHDESKQEIPTSLATKDLDILIKNKLVTVIGTGDASKYLDGVYGFQSLPNLWETNQTSFIAVFATISIFILLFLWAKHKNREQENKNDEFLEWSRNHMHTISLFTLLAGADIEVLTLLESKIAGYSFFNAKFSETALSKIFWGTLFNLFEEIPQVIIQ